MGNAWKRGRADQQLRDWFEMDVDFLLTFYAPGMLDLTDRDFCAVIEHELYHCAQAEDGYGAPKFDRETGAPDLCDPRPRRRGILGRCPSLRRRRTVRELVEAAKRAPIVGDSSIAIACGTCDQRLS
jgi:hypothetical protein